MTQPAASILILSTREAAARCGVSTETIRRWIKHKGLPAHNTELGLKIRIRLDELEAFAARHNILIVSAGLAENSRVHTQPVSAPTGGVPG